jgi:molybdopterin synthase sulfur carrier subunit
MANYRPNTPSPNLCDGIIGDCMANVNVKFYGVLVESARNQKEIKVDAASVRELLKRLVDTYGDNFKQRVLDTNGEPQQFINVFVNNTDIRHLKNAETSLTEGDEVLIIPAVAGG